MEEQEKSMRPIPKNVRQIGERDDEVKLYIEDYVNTFIRKCAKTDRLALGALIGSYGTREGREYLFVEGAVQAEFYRVVEGRVVMTDEAWSDLYGKISEFFAGRSLCGWFICSGESENCNVGMIRGFMYENIEQDKRALIIHNTEIEEEALSVYDQNFIREQRGYYLFYERNEAMQSYMVTTRYASRTDPVSADALTAAVRTRMVEKKEQIPRAKRRSPLAPAAFALGAAALALAVGTLNHYDRMRNMETALTGLVGNFLPFLNEPAAGGSEPAGETAGGGLLVEDVTGGIAVPPKETPPPETAPEETVSGNEEEPSGAPPEQTEPESEPQTEPQTEPETESQTEPPRTEPPATEAGAEEYRTYLVERGDTLVSICREIYGYQDEALMDRICEINGLADKDHIYAGQELRIP